MSATDRPHCALQSRRADDKRSRTRRVCTNSRPRREANMADELLHAYGFLTQPEVRFLDAAVERLIPTDELGAGGRDAGCTVYIDRQLFSVWGSHGRNYRSGPWLEGTPEQGFQSRLTPQEIYRI